MESIIILVQMSLGSTGIVLFINIWKTGMFKGTVRREKVGDVRHS